MDKTRFEVWDNLICHVSLEKTLLSLPFVNWFFCACSNTHLYCKHSGWWLYLNVYIAALARAPRGHLQNQFHRITSLTGRYVNENADLVNSGRVLWRDKWRCLTPVAYNNVKVCILEKRNLKPRAWNGNRFSGNEAIIFVNVSTKSMHHFKLDLHCNVYTCSSVKNRPWLTPITAKKTHNAAILKREWN